MGKYMRKAKITGDVAVMDVSLGVRTRAKTLALQRLQATTPPASPQSPELSYLQLRNRRLEKPLLNQSACRENPDTKNPGQNPNPKKSSRLRLSSGNSGSFGSVSISNFSNKKEGFLVERNENETTDDTCDLGTEASFGDNNLDFEGRERSTRESTPCSLIRDLNTLGTPGSSTRPTSLSASNRRVWDSAQRNMPMAHEIEEFFCNAEQQQQRLFAEKYNFDVVKDLPLPGRYEWVRV